MMNQNINYSKEELQALLMAAAANGVVGMVRHLVPSIYMNTICDLHQPQFILIDALTKLQQSNLIFANCLSNPSLIKNGRTALMHAAANGHSNVVNFLLSIDKNMAFTRGCDGETALMLAAKNGYSNIVGDLFSIVKQGASHRSHSEQKTALIYAAQNGHTSVVEVLLNEAYGAKIALDVEDVHGKTALIYASEGGHAVIVGYLLDGNGARPEHLNKAFALFNFNAENIGVEEKAKVLALFLEKKPDIMENRIISQEVIDGAKSLLNDKNIINQSYGFNNDKVLSALIFLELQKNSAAENISLVVNNTANPANSSSLNIIHAALTPQNQVISSSDNYTPAVRNN